MAGRPHGLGPAMLAVDKEASRSGTDGANSDATGWLGGLVAQAQ